MFISYAGEDGNVARELAAGLEAHGIAAWYYQRDSLPGISYLQQILRSLETCSACIVLLSSHALESFQVDREITRVYEANLPVIPILIGMGHEEFRARRPEWAMMLGTVVTVPLPQDGISSLLPQIINSLDWAPPARTGEIAPQRRAPRVRLPAPATPFVGRAGEVAALGALLEREEVRLVTLTGPGGCGKTRVALEVASRYFDRYPDGLFFVPLGGVRDPGLVLPAIATALDVQEEPSHPLMETLRAAVSQRRLLLLLDNLEHLPAAFPLVGELLAASAALTVLATSRVALHLQGEHEYAMGPMRPPDTGRHVEPAELAANEAVTLFVQRAEAAKPNFQLTAGNAPTIAEICARLDGLPLALELAAARIKLFAPEALLKRLEKRLAILSGGAVDAGKRQETLRNTIDWSYRLLTESEQRLFRRLAVFAGGCTIESAEATVGEAGNDVFEGLSSLVDQSLLRQVQQEDGEPRFAMLETIREFAAERLLESAEESAIGRRHAAYFTALAEEAKPNLQGPESKAWLERLESEIGNLMVAADWSRSAGDEMALRLPGALFSFWYRSHLSQGREQLDRALDAGITATPHARLTALLAAGNLAHVQADYQRASTLLQEALTLSRTLEAPKNVANVLNNLGAVTVDAGDLEKGAKLYQESLGIRRDIDDRPGIATSLNNLATIAQYRRQYDEAASLYQESLELWRTLGNEWAAGVTLANLAEVAVCKRDPDRAATLYRDSLILASKLDDQVGAAVCIEGLAVTRAATAAAEAAGFLATADSIRDLAGAARSSREQ
ncbi:MAG TPA: tetratricopeptide repeat protein, partial [Chloroflexota bacterium]|nr:tetratricopeptide repeat protein [Chloroflexota bacterium]